MTLSTADSGSLLSARAPLTPGVRAEVQAIVKIVQFCLDPGLSIEATRLLSSLIRYSKDPEVVRISSAEKVTPLLLTLLNSPHSQLINETLVALFLLSASLPPITEVVEEILNFSATRFLKSWI